jgi:glycosyltransferase involved in cell wall biosynthesis
MNDSKMISVILPTRNRAKFIGPSIDSIINQTYTNWELIIVDGASEDNTPKVAKEFAKSNERIRYHRSFPRQGLPRDRNIGVSMSKGDFIFFIEDDLILKPDCLEILVATYQELKISGKNIGSITPRTIIPKKKCVGYLKRIWDLVGDSKRRTLNVPSFLDEKTGIIYSNWDIDLGYIQETIDSQSWSLFDEEVLKEIGGFEENAYKGTYIREEADLFFRLRSKGYKLYFQPNAIAFHERVDTGGCNVLPARYYYYFIRNHIIFLERNFGMKSLYMIPLFLFFITYNTFKAAIKLTLPLE